MTPNTNEPIELSPYDPRWPQLFDDEAARLNAVFAAAVHSIEHIGSTAVPGIAAKPVIDILLVLYEPVDAQDVNLRLESLGYREMPPGPPADVCFHVRRNAMGRRIHQVHAVVASPVVDARLRFRDLLRARRDQAMAYEALKLQLAERFCNDRDAYIEGKTRFITDLLEQ